MKKEFDLKINGGTLESIKIDSSNSLIVATYKRDVAEFKAGDILIDAYDEDRALEHVSIFKGKSKIDDTRFSAFIAFKIYSGTLIYALEDWDEIKNNRLATDEEKQILFDALKKEGKRWNADKLKIEKLAPEFKRGDILVSKTNPTVVIFDKYTSHQMFNSLFNSQAILSNNNWYAPTFRHASAEEIEDFYKYLARMGKKWNAETLEIENIKPEFKRGDILASRTSTTVLVFDKYTRCDVFDSIINNSNAVSDNDWKAEIFRHASAEEIEVFYKALARMGKKWNAETLEVEKLDISEIVVDYESAIKYLGIQNTLLVFKSYDRVEKFNAQIKLQIIAEAWNKFDKFEADWENRDQSKYFPMFRVGGGKIEFARTSLSWGYLDFHTSNFSFKTEERAKQFAEQFIDLFKVALGF